MSDYLFPPPPVSAVAVAGEDRLYPVQRIFCVGRNYEAHAKEMGVEVDREAPFYFIKGNYAIVPSGATIPYPPQTANYHHEMELVIAIGTDAFEVPVETALDAVFGYACGLDMTRRDLQLVAREKGRPWDFGKDFEQSAVITPIVPVAQCGHFASGSIQLEVNGTRRQDADLEQLIWKVPEIISHLSRHYHLRAGDLIYTGTPEGVGAVVSGDRITGRIDGLGDIALNIA